MTGENIIGEFIQNHLSEAKRRSRGVYEFISNFQRAFPIESIRNMTLEEYLYVPYDEYVPSSSFCSRIWREANIMSSKGNVRTNIFGIYTKDNQIKIFGKYLSPYGDDYNAAFIYLRQEIYNLLVEVGKGNYEAAVTCPINGAFKYKLLEIYYPDRFIHVHTESTLNDYCDCIGLAYDPSQDLIYRNLAMVEWKNSVPELSGWNNSVIMSFCDWLWRNNKKIDGHLLTTNYEEKAVEIDNDISAMVKEGTERQAIIKARVNQDVFRDLLLKKYNKCCLCGVSNPKLLRASHIKPWSVSTAKEKLDIDNGFLMCPNHDLLFDKGWITFDDDGNIIISEALSDLDQTFMNVRPSMKIEINEKIRFYLAYHREFVFES